MRLRLVPDVTHINFFRFLRFWLAVSVIGVIGSMAAYLTLGLNYGIDFRGGTIVMAETPEPHDIAAFRDVLNELDIGEVAVTEISGDADGHVVLMRIGITGEDPDSQAAVISSVRQALGERFPGIDYLQVDSVGAKVSAELVWAGVLAVVLSLAAIMVYIWLRFEWQFALGAVLSLLHDAIVTIGVFSVLQLEFNLTIIAALLTIIGYSINDTVVVFDRVRESLRKYKKTPLIEVVNMALNETLSRTVMTSGTTLIALAALFLLGGPLTAGFSFAVIFGVLIGTYSSIYVATAVVLWLGVKRDWSKPHTPGGTQFGDIKA